MTARTKPDARARKRAARREALQRIVGLAKQDRIAKSCAITGRIRDLLAELEPKCVLTFAALASEPDLAALWQAPKLQWAVPKINGEMLEIWRVFSPGGLVRGDFGVLEPAADRCRLLRLEDPDLILVPGLAFDRSDGMRLGRGKGYFDRFLAQRKVATCGVCFEEQMLERVPREDHDQPVDRVVTDLKLWEFRGRSR